MGELPACQEGAFGRAKGWSPAWSILIGLGRAGRKIFSRAGLPLPPVGKEAWMWWPGGCPGVCRDSGWFPGLPWGAATWKAGILFLAGQQDTCFGGKHFYKRFPLLCSSFPRLRAALPCPFPGLFTARGVISDGAPWAFSGQQGFLLRVWASHFASPLTCRAGCPGAGGSLRIPTSASTPPRCWRCRGARVEGRCCRDPGRVPSPGHPQLRGPFPSCLNFHGQISFCSRANILL